MRSPHEVVRAVRTELAHQRVASHPSELTVGIELEAFLSRHDGEPADRLAEARFFRTIATDARSEPDVDPLSGVRIASSAARACTVKLDHRPHLLELAFDPAPDLHVLAVDVCDLVDRVQAFARSAGLTLRFEARAPWSAEHPTLLDPDPRMEALRRTRREWRASRGMAGDAEADNYAAVIAATQVHVGGLQWWDRPERIARLYAAEADVLPFAALLNGGYETLRARLAAYGTAFPSAPLILFPRFDEFRLEAWAAAVLASPLLDDETEIEDAGSLLRRARDLSIIKPRISGTVEFRGDPSLPSPRAVIAMAALRLGAACLAMDDDAASMPLSEAHDRWRLSLLRGDAPDGAFLHRARDGLIRRGLGEETFLAELEVGVA